MDNAKRVINGTWGEVWLNNEYVSECYGLQAKMAYDKQDISLCGRLATDKKITGMKGTGSLKLHKVSSRMAIALQDAMQQGLDVRFTVISKLSDPDAYGSERVVLENVSFDDLTLSDWEAATVGKVEAPFTFTGFKYLDTIEAR